MPLAAVAPHQRVWARPGLPPGRRQAGAGASPQLSAASALPLDPGAAGEPGRCTGHETGRARNLVIRDHEWSDARSVIGRIGPVVIGSESMRSSLQPSLNGPTWLRVDHLGASHVVRGRRAAAVGDRDLGGGWWPAIRSSTMALRSPDSRVVPHCFRGLMGGRLGAHDQGRADGLGERTGQISRLAGSGR